MVIAKKWGSSIGIVLPKEIVKEQGIKAGDEIIIKVFRKGELRDIFGKLKSDMPGQKFKNMVRKGRDTGNS